MARHWLLWLGAALLVALAGLLIVNGRGGGETQVERHIERVHALSDVAFARELGVLLGNFGMPWRRIEDVHLRPPTLSLGASQRGSMP